MTLALFLWTFPALVVFLYVVKPFLHLPFPFSVAVGALFFLVFGWKFWSLSFPEGSWATDRKEKVDRLVLIMSFVIVVWLGLTVARHGPSAFLYFLMGQEAPQDVLCGAYREKLRLKALWSPWMIVMGFLSFAAGSTHWKGWCLKAWVLLVFIFYMGIYETRHVGIWLFLYLFFFFCFGKHDLQRILRRPFLWVGVLFLSAIFVFLGNLREGLTKAYHDSTYFVRGYDLNSAYAVLPRWTLWIVLYLFSGLARGVVNSDQIELFHFYLPPNAFPGVLQRSIDFQPLQLVERFSPQHFAVDGWHNTLFCFGWVGGILFMFFFMGVVYRTAARMAEEMVKQGTVATWWLSPFLLWACTRLALFFTGNYILDFAGLVELLLLCGVWKFSAICWRRASEGEEKRTAEPQKNLDAAGNE